MRPSPITRVLLAVVVLLGASACHRATDPDPLVGTYLATTFLVTPSGQGVLNVLALGGTLGLNVANNYVTSGTLIVPASVNGGSTFTASLAGTATRTGSSVRFTQSADIFVRDLTFTLAENRLEAVDQVVGGTRYNIILTRQ